MLTTTFRGKASKLRAKTQHPFGNPVFTALPLLALALPAHLASTDQTLWLSSVLYAGLAVTGPKSGTVLKACEVMAASVLCALALVNTGA
jgi:hypothetical protein